MSKSFCCWISNRTCFTKDFFAHNSNSIDTSPCCISIIGHRIATNILHMQSCRVQNFVAITLLELRWAQNRDFHQIRVVSKKLLVKLSPEPQGTDRVHLTPGGSSRCNYFTLHQHNIPGITDISIYVVSSYHQNKNCCVQLTHYGFVMLYGNRYVSTLAQVTAWCLTSPSQYLHQCWIDHQRCFVAFSWEQFHKKDSWI